jgi:hypothetical protein
MLKIAVFVSESYIPLILSKKLNLFPLILSKVFFMLGKSKNYFTNPFIVKRNELLYKN